MAVTVIYYLQRFYIYYGMYVVTMKLSILLLLFFFYIGSLSTLIRLKRNNLREKIPTIKNKVS